jgi:hypothetical protein
MSDNSFDNEACDTPTREQVFTFGSEELKSFNIKEEKDTSEEIDTNFSSPVKS